MDEVGGFSLVVVVVKVVVVAPAAISCCGRAVVVVLTCPAFFFRRWWPSLPPLLLETVRRVPCRPWRLPATASRNNRPALANRTSTSGDCVVMGGR